MRIFNQVVLDEFLVDTVGGTVHFTDARWSPLLATADSLVSSSVGSVSRYSPTSAAPR